MTLSGHEYGSFAFNAARLAGLMSVLFHWPPQTFWASTPQEVAGMFEALGLMRGDGVDAGTMAALQARYPD